MKKLLIFSERINQEINLTEIIDIKELGIKEKNHLLFIRLGKRLLHKKKDDAFNELKILLLN